MGLSQSLITDIFVCPPPVVAVTMSQYVLYSGQTAIVTFTFSRVPVGFSISDIDVQNGVLSNLLPTENPLIFRALFTPFPNTFDETNVITVGTGWADRRGNTPISSSFSNNYIVDTIDYTVRITTDNAFRITTDGNKRRVVL